ncbi:DivIVA domain-containing protein [Arthrobacter sp. NEB 688]|uniref:DivIVA domain-containing protein n=1 Tax=Arthrobacter sp. NEB 688 TaxID=904039 RepID=UPI001565E798|nr:DivIVA domain-containing protein [Arthrobacter sp. NEB 688]QKE83521.1 DivIVA domain-containing protein [Arthrobacter sp. NEB 688]
MLTPEDVLTSTFTQTQFRDGYDEGQVDDLLDAVAETLRAHAGTGRPPRRPLTAAGLRASRLSVTRMRRGYDMAEVDALLERAATALDALERGGAPAGAAAPPTAPPTASPPSAPSGALAAPSGALAAPSGPREGLGARLLRVLRGDPRG